MIKIILVYSQQHAVVPSLFIQLILISRQADLIFIFIELLARGSQQLLQLQLYCSTVLLILFFFFSPCFDKFIIICNALYLLHSTPDNVEDPSSPHVVQPLLDEFEVRTTARYQGIKQNNKFNKRLRVRKFLSCCLCYDLRELSVLL